LKIKKFKIKNFRNLEDTLIYPDEGKNILIGNNAQGKSNIIEAMYFLSTTRSYRVARVNDLIKWGSEWFFVHSEVLSGNIENDIKLYYSLKKKVYPSIIFRKSLPANC